MLRARRPPQNPGQEPSVAGVRYDRPVSASPPAVSGALDATYLRAALGRAGRPADAELLGIELLTEGRVNASVSRLVTSAGSFVWKPVSRGSWSQVGLGDGVGEAPLWLAGATRALPPPLSCPTLDVADHPETD